MDKFRTALNKALELLAGLSMAVMVILLYSILNIIGIANGTISLEVADEASEAIAKVEAEKAAANEKKEG